MFIVVGPVLPLATYEYILFVRSDFRPPTNQTKRPLTGLPGEELETPKNHTTPLNGPLTGLPGEAAGNT